MNRKFMHTYRSGVLFLLLLGMLFVTGCISIPAKTSSGAASNAQELLGSWQLVSMTYAQKRVYPKNPSDYSIRFDEKNVYLALETNRGSSGYRALEEFIALTSPMVMTKAAWRSGSFAPRLLSLFEQIHSYTIINKKELLLESETGSLRFTRVPNTKN